jgi:hypothetical protein
MTRTLGRVYERLDAIDCATQRMPDAANQLQTVMARLDRTAFRLHRIVPDDLQRYVNECVELRARQLTGDAQAKRDRARRRADELEAWVAALAGGRESMQAQARQGLPDGIDPETRGRLVSHLERHQIKLSASAGSGGGSGAAPVRARDAAPQR